MPETRDLAGYRVLRELGRGGMGLVYEAEHLQLGRHAALKLLEPHLAKDSGFRSRFIEESRLVAAMDHPNIIPIYDAGESDGMLYIAMRLVRGSDLHALVAHEGPLPPERALAILAQVAAALDAAHARDLVHRDVKPANILLEELGRRVFLTDFGVAKRGRSSGATREGQFVGTADYAPPEQIEGKDVGHTADVYAFGCVVYECLSGRRPYDKETDVAVLFAHLRDPPPRLTEHAPKFPRAIDDVIAVALAKQPQDRYQSCGDLIAAVEAALGAGTAETTRSRTQVTGSVPEPLAAPTSLPVPPTAFVGREHDVARLAELLSEQEARLVTITGPGGAGKTRVAIEAARRSMQAFPDGIVFVPLAALADATLVLPAIAEALGLEDDGAATLRERVRGRLRGASLLLVLDNFEHVLPAASTVADLLTLGSVTVLVTSQSPLRLQGERGFPLPPLDLDSGIALFTDRAAAVGGGRFELDDRARVAVRELCARLDGLPLAIELAAARTRLLSTDELLSRLEDRFALLTGGSRDVPSRHQTLRGTIEWSHDLLAADGQILLARLAVFEDGFTLDAVERVCGEELDVLSGIESLLDMSLLQQRGAATGESRFDLLQTIQEFGRYKLIERHELDALRKGHAECYLALAELAEPELFGGEQARWVARLDEETGNIRAALSWAVDGGSIETALRLAGALTRFWSVRGQMTECRRWLDRALDRAEKADPGLLGKAFFGAGYAALGQGDFEEAFARFDQGVTSYRAAEDEGGVAACLAQLGWLEMNRGNLDRAGSISEESLGLARKHDDRRTESGALINLGEVAARRGDTAAANALFEEALAIRRQLADQRNIANAVLLLGRNELLGGRFDQARSRLGEGLDLAAGVHDTWGRSVALSSLAAVSLRQADPERAAQLFGDALRLCRERGDRRASAECLVGLAGVAANGDDHARAARLAGAAATLRDEMNIAASPIEQAILDDFLSMSAAQLGAEAFAAEDRAGRELGFEGAVAYALVPSAQPTVF